MSLVLSARGSQHRPPHRWCDGVYCWPEWGPPGPHITLQLGVPAEGQVDPWFWREGGFVRSHLGASLLMRLPLQVPGELVVMATGTHHQCTEEEGSRWLLGCAAGLGGRAPQARAPEPQGACEQLCRCWQLAERLDFVTGGPALKLSFLLSVRFPLSLAALCVPSPPEGPSLLCPYDRAEFQPETHSRWPPFLHPSSLLV